MATGRHYDDLCAVDLRDVEDGGWAVRVGKRRFDIPNHAAPLIDAMVLERRLAGADDTDPLFVHVQGTGRRHGQLGRLPGKAMRNQLKRAERETGLLLTRHWTPKRNEDAISWVLRRGISVIAI
jgi:hypothetical protein